PVASQATMLRQFSTMDPSKPVNGYGLGNLGTPVTPLTGQQLNKLRWDTMQAPFGQLANMFAATALPFPNIATGFLGLSQGVADVFRNPATGVPILDPASGSTPAAVRPYGAPTFNRILDFVQVPSRFVGTDTMLNAETFNDVP